MVHEAKMNETPEPKHMKIDPATGEITTWELTPAEKEVYVSLKRIIKLEDDVKLLWEALKTHTGTLKIIADRLEQLEEQVQKLRFRP